MVSQLPRRQAFERSPRTARIAPCRQSSLLTWPLALARAPYRRLPSVNCLIGEALPDDAFQRAFGAGHVVNAQLHPVAVAEIEFREITVKVLLLAVLVNALHPAFEDAVVSFDGVGVGFEAGLAVGVAVFLAAMIDGRVIRERAAKTGVVRGFVGHHMAFARKVFAHERRDAGDGRAVNVERARRAAALHKGQDRVLVASASANDRALFAANEGFIDFDGLAFPAQWRHAADAHGLTDAMAHEPRGFEGHAKGPVKLVRADPFLGRANQVHRLEPKTKSNMARFEDGPDFDGEGLPASVALVEADAVGFALERATVTDDAAMRANAAFRPNMRFNVSESCFFVLETGFVKDGRHDS